MPTQYGLVKQYIDSGDFRTLGILAEESVPLMPKIPTFKEQGVDISFEKFYFYAFPPGTPQEVVNQFTNALKAVVEENEEYRSEAEKFFVSPTYMTPEETSQYMQETFQYYEGLLEAIEQ
ncbi:tripartite tricarboxylate transporter substrate-binding protein [Caldalkalibacillus uzonensis]|nr:tripartite tricarboxylate transporter substrate-binding protein [Caldalkalibacillus uzonensis]